MPDEPATLTAKATEATKKHGFKAAGVGSIAGIILAGQAYFAPLSDYRETRRDVQDLRERISQLEWAHERKGRHGELVVGQHAVTNEISDLLAVRRMADFLLIDDPVNPTRKDP